MELKSNRSGTKSREGQGNTVQCHCVLNKCNTMLMIVQCWYCYVNVVREYKQVEVNVKILKVVMRWKSMMFLSPNKCGEVLLFLKYRIYTVVRNEDKSDLAMWIWNIARWNLNYQNIRYWNCSNRTAKTINNQNIGISISAKWNKVETKSENVQNILNRCTIVWGMHR
jgi:hypothetical protein